MDANEIRKWHTVFFPDNAMFEIRILGGGPQKRRNWSGYFTDIEDMLGKLQPFMDTSDKWIGKPQFYFTLNEIDPELYGRSQHDCFVDSAVATSDNDIVRRRWVLIDFDPVRKKDLASSQSELKAAHDAAANVYRYLKTMGFKEPVIALSGNGYHLLYKVDMPNDEEHKELIKDFIDALASKYSDNIVDVDKSVFNAGRICKLYGTEARKGSCTEERPWRTARILYPKDGEVVYANEDALLRKVIDSVTVPSSSQEQTATRQAYQGNDRFDLERWLNAHGLEYRIKWDGGIQKFQLKVCPFEEMHSTHHEWDSAICVMPDGKIAFTCFHSHCKDKKWSDVRKLYEPGYQPYAERQYSNPQAVIVQQAPLKEKVPQIKQQSDDLGPMWYEFDEIPDIDLNSLEKIPTGITALDEKIHGLYLSEVSIMSGTNSSGKSSFLNTLLLNAVDDGYKCALWSGELRADVLKAWIDMVAAGKKHLSKSVKTPGAYYVSKAVKDRINKWLHGKFVLYNNNYGSKWEQVLMQMKQKQEQGFKLFVLDNLMKLDIDILGDGTNRQQKSLVEELGNFAKEKQVHIILVAHPRKSSGRGMSSFLRKDDISGSGNIADLADNVFIIHRNNKDFRRGMADFYDKTLALEYQPEDSFDAKGKMIPRGAKGDVGNVIEVCKNRLYGVQDALVDLYYEPESRRFKNSPFEEKEYGWNTDALTHQEEMFQADKDSGDNAFEEVSGDLPF